MDLPLFFRVMWRFRVLMIVGMILAFFAAVFVTARVSLKNGKPALTYRQPQSWTTHSTLLVTQQGFSLGSSVSRSTLKNPTTSGAITPQLTDPSRFTTYALTYSELADSDPVHALMRRAGPLVGTYTASAVTSPQNGNNALPFIRIDSIADTPQHAAKTAQSAANGLIEYIKEMQDAGHVADSARIQLVSIEKGAPPTLLHKRSMFRPLAAFIVLMLLFCILAFVLENLRPRVRRVEATPLRDGAPADEQAARRTA